MIYTTYEYYKSNGGTLDEDIAIKYIKKASYKVDSLTFNRIVGLGFDNLTEFQQNIIKEVTCLIADFDYSTSLNAGLNSYSINGVSMNFDKSNLVTVNGIEIEKDTYSLLSQTGLTYLGGI